MKNKTTEMSPERVRELLAAVAGALDPELQKEEIVAIETAVEYVERRIPKKVLWYGKWLPAICPTCGEELSTHITDGYYDHHTDWGHCPNSECRQKIYWDTSKEDTC